MLRFLSILKPVVPFVIVAIATLVAAYPFYQHVKTERDQMQTLLFVTQDSLHREQSTRLETQVRLLELENRDNLIMARYQNALNRQWQTMDSIKRAVLVMGLQKQREYLRAQIQAIPQLTASKLPDIGRYVTPISYWRTQSDSLTCYDAKSVANLTAAVAERDELRSMDTLRAEAFERLKQHYVDYRTATESIADYGLFRSKGKAIRRLLRATQIPESP